MNEVFTLILFYHVICLNEKFNLGDESRENVGTSFVFTVFCSVFLNFFFLFRTVYQTKVDKIFRDKRR